MKKMVKFLLLLGFVCSVGIIYAIVNFGTLMDGFEWEEDEDEQTD